MAIYWVPDLLNIKGFSIGVRAPPDLGGGDVLALKHCAMPERGGIETGMQTETFIIFSSNETAIFGKIAQLKVCILKVVRNSFHFPETSSQILF